MFIRKFSKFSEQFSFITPLKTFQDDDCLMKILKLILYWISNHMGTQLSAFHRKIIGINSIWMTGNGQTASQFVFSYSVSCYVIIHLKMNGCGWYAKTKWWFFWQRFVFVCMKRYSCIRKTAAEEISYYLLSRVYFHLTNLVSHNSSKAKERQRYWISL